MCSFNWCSLHRVRCMYIVLYTRASGCSVWSSCAPCCSCAHSLHIIAVCARDLSIDIFWCTQSIVHVVFPLFSLIFKCKKTGFQIVVVHLFVHLFKLIFLWGDHIAHGMVHMRLHKCTQLCVQCYQSCCSNCSGCANTDPSCAHSHGIFLQRAHSSLMVKMVQSLQFVHWVLFESCTHGFAKTRLYWRTYKTKDDDIYSARSLWWSS